MGFFDLNIPYHESDRHAATDKPSLQRRRLKLALKAMELGYTGIAYNRTLKGVMSESDRCATALFPLSKLTPSDSSFFAAVKLHRELLNVAVSSPFRQYTRLTVVVDVASQASSLNAGNPVLKSYDVVAVRPVNQNAFDQACQTSEVDVIAVDFSEKLPFRLKQPMVKAAIKRGVYFEITYSGLIADAQTRRQMISNCKLLVDWTRGKNLIFSSAAPSVTELRGPQDVSNLFSLLGLPIERAKAAISNNCRSLLVNALRKKTFYKEAVKVEKIPSDRRGFDDWLNWDPISSGEGDLLLDDLEKSFASSNNTLTKTVETMNFSSNMNGHGLLIKDLICTTETTLEPQNTNNFIPAAMEIEKTSPVENPEKQGCLNPSREEAISGPENQGRLSTFSKAQGEDSLLPEGQNSSSHVTNMNLVSSCQDSIFPLSYVPKDTVAPLPLPEDGQTSEIRDSVMSSLPTYKDTCTYPDEPVSVSSEKLNYSNDSEARIVTSETQILDSPSQVYGGDALNDGGRVHIATTDSHASIELCNPLDKSCSSAFHLEESNVENQCELGVCTHEEIEVYKVSNVSDCEKRQGLPLASSEAFPQDAYVEKEQFSEMTNDSVTLGDPLPIEEFLNLSTEFNEPISYDVMGEISERKHIDSVTNYRRIGKSQAGKERKKRKSHHQPFLLPFNRFLNPRPLKRKSRK